MGQLWTLGTRARSAGRECPYRLHEPRLRRGHRHGAWRAGRGDGIEVQGLRREGELDVEGFGKPQDLQEYVVPLAQLIAPGRDLEEEVHHDVQGMRPNPLM